MIQLRGFAIPCDAEAIAIGDAFVSRGYESVSLCVRVKFGEKPQALVIREVGRTNPTPLPAIVNLDALGDSVSRIEGEVLIVPNAPSVGAFMQMPSAGSKTGSLFIGRNGEAIIASAHNGRRVYVSIVGEVPEHSIHHLPAYDSWSLVWRDGARQEVLANFPSSS